MPDDIYKTIAHCATGFFKDRQSKFYSFAYPVINEKQIKQKQEFLRKKYYDASHHVYAFMIGENYDNFRYSDDGEPSNSSGPPVFNIIKSKNLTNILIVVLRYFGGKKLGIPGLINAYKTAAEEALNNSKIIEKTIDVLLNLEFGYSKINKVMYLTDKFNAKIIEQKFTADCKMKIAVRKSQTDKLKDILKQNLIKII